MNDTKVLSSEYSRFRSDIIDKHFRRILSRKPVVVLDPMAGTAPLIPIIESGGYKAYFNDILPLHFFINQAKTYRIFDRYRQRGQRWFFEQLLSRMGRLNGQQLKISEKWIDESVLDGLIEAWNEVEQYDVLYSLIKKYYVGSSVVIIRYRILGN